MSDNAEQMLFDMLREHIGHNIECVAYKDKRNGDIVNVSIECVDCSTVLTDYNNPEYE